MKIMLIQPPISDYYRTRFREYPLGLLYLSSALERDGHDVKILDARLCKNPKTIVLPQELSRLQEQSGGAKSIFQKYKYFGISYSKIEDEVKKYSPDIVGINAMCTPYVSEVIETARAVKEAMHDCKVIVGGYHATVDPESLIACNEIDVVVRGEGENVFREILGEDIKNGIVEKEDGSSHKIEDLNELAYPARHLIPSTNYIYGKKQYTMLLTSRGCPHSCSFCCVHAIAGSQYRTRNIDSVVDEVDECIGKHGIQIFDLQDDNLLYDRVRVKDFFEKLISRHEKKSIEFLASNGLNIAHIDAELLRLMKKCGFTKLDISIGTGDVTSRAFLNRPESVRAYEEVFDVAKALGFAIATYIIIGIPSQPLSHMKETISYLIKKGAFIAPSVFYNVPGMPIFDSMKKYEYVDSHVVRRGTAVNCFGEDFERRDILDLLSEVRLHNLSLRKY